jgi:curved DNA-binding protein CbpA
MPPTRRDPYRILGVKRTASDAELRAAYRGLVQRYHPDHNRGSAESTRRFEEVQDAYAEIRDRRARARSAGRSEPSPAPDPNLDARLADLERTLRQAQVARERKLREARAARERARRAASQPTSDARARPSDEELGYVHTDDTLSNILADAEAELSRRLANVREHPVARRLSDLIAELEAKLTGGPPASAGG